MTVPTLEDRAAGLLLHPTSLPGAFGNGDLGPGAHRFVSYLAAAGQRWWQMLPIHPVGGGYSPYDGLSAFAGALHLVSPEALVTQGWLTPAEARPARPEPGGPARYAQSLRYRESRLRRAFARFEARADPAAQAAWHAFCAQEAHWLEDYTLFAALKRAHGGVHWARWPAPLRSRRRAALAEARHRLAGEVRFRTFVQYQFDLQWQALRAACAQHGIALLGDLPIFVAHDSADAWAHPELFFMDRHGRCDIVAGVPPDAFSADGQRWGNPLYDWARHKRDGYAWWSARLRASLRRFDAVRLDHFIGFVRYWAIPATQKTARHGRFRPGPGSHFLNHLAAAFGALPLVAEDLGIVTPAVTALREQFALPGMRVLQFAFGGDDPGNPHLPHNHERSSVVYTGTHDNDTIVGWAGGPTPDALRPEARRALAWLGAGSGASEPIWQAMIHMAYASVANLAVVPVQDVLGLGPEARMNLPGTPSGNWCWRLPEGALTAESAEWLRLLTLRYGRAAPAPAASHPV